MRKSSFGRRPPRGRPNREHAGSGAPDARRVVRGDRAGKSSLHEAARGRKADGAFGGKESRPGFAGKSGRVAGGGKPHGAREERAEHAGRRHGETPRDREGGAGASGGARLRFRSRPNGGARGGEREGPEAVAREGGPPPGIRVRQRPAPKGSRYDRMDRPEWRGRFAEKQPRSRPGAGKGAPARIAAVAEPMRIAKAMARAGLCSRREAERWIADGRVSLNGQVLKTPAVEVKPRDRVLVDGVPLPVAEPAQLWRYNKPRGLVTTHNDPQGRPTVFDSLPPGLPRVISVGRLDFNTEGLILLTNDGELARHLELPATGWLRRYRVRCKGRVTGADLERLKEGVEIEGVRYGPVEAAIDTVQGANMWLTVGIREGKNREVRKVLASLGLDVNRLIRISFGPFQLLDLKPGEAEIVRRRVLADQLGPDLAAEFGLVETGDKKPDGGKSGKPSPGPKRKDKEA